MKWDPIKIDPEATYTKQALAMLFEVTPRYIEKEVAKRRGRRFPRPFYVGRTPLWQGRVVAEWLDKQQREACPA